MGSLSLRPQNVNLNHLRVGFQKYTLLQQEESIKVYEENIPHCSNLKCNKILPFGKRNAKFCNNSCAATHNNHTRSPDVKTGPEKTTWPFTRVTFKKCALCQKIFLFKKDRVKWCSDDCKQQSTTTRRLYRNVCSFNVNQIDHSELFDSDLIAEYGWYCPASSNIRNQNISGLSWDHLYRIEQGFKNNIDYKLLKHPANAELVPWPVNRGRKTSQITLDELKERIKRWDSGDRNLPRFFKR